MTCSATVGVRAIAAWVTRARSGVMPAVGSCGSPLRLSARFRWLSRDDAVASYAAGCWRAITKLMMGTARTAIMTIQIRRRMIRAYWRRLAVADGAEAVVEVIGLPTLQRFRQARYPPGSPRESTRSSRDFF